MSGILSEQPLLSICIPTYNRANILKESLDAIILDDAFDSRVEIIISDNASLDNTQSVGKKYAKEYKNILYFRNSENLKDENFYLALSHANGRYIRLFNDTLRFKPKALSSMLSIIESSDDNYGLFFFQNNHLCSGKTYRVIGVNKFLDYASFSVTWIANWGCWSKDLRTISNPNKYAYFQLSQVDWFLRLACRNNRIDICFADWFDSVIPNKKGGYNIFIVFVENYFSILKTFLCKKRLVDFVSIEKEKYRLFRYFIIPWYYKLIIKGDSNFSFILTDADKIIFSCYKYSIYYYAVMFLLYIRKMSKHSIVHW